MVHGRHLNLSSISQEGVLPALRKAPEDYDIEDVRITAIHVERNPDKLKHLHQASVQLPVPR
jgi:hypothetical protein